MIATHLIAIIRKVILRALHGVNGEASHTSYRFIHLLTGYVIGTNEAAARRLLCHMKAVASPFGVLYRLLV